MNGKPKKDSPIKPGPNKAPDTYDWNVSDKEYEEMESIVNKNKLCMGHIDNIRSKIEDCLAAKDKQLANIFKAKYMKPENKFNVKNDLKNLQNSKIVEYLTKNSKYKKEKIIRLIPDFTRSFIKALVLSKNNHLEFVTFIIDSFSRYWIKHNFHNNENAEYNVSNFVDTLDFDGINQKNGIKELIHDVIKDFYQRFGKHPGPNLPLRLINDDINKYIDFILNLNIYFQRDDDDDDDEKINFGTTHDNFWLYGKYPIQFDVWIIPTSTSNNDDAIINNDYQQYQEYYADDDDDDDKDDMNNNNNDDDKKENVASSDTKKIAEIGTKLKSKGITYYVSDIDDDYWTPHKIDRHFKKFQDGNDLKGHGMFNNKKDVEKFERYKRFIIIYDRRKEVWNGRSMESQKNSKLYIFKAMKDFDEFSKEHFKYLYQYQSFYYSKRCVVPEKHGQKPDGKRGKNASIGLFDVLSGYMFGISYHFISKDCIRIYWQSHGTSLRFYKDDMINVWPRFFGEHNDENNKKMEKPIQAMLLNKLKKLKQFKDDPFDEFFGFTVVPDKFIQIELKEAMIRELSRAFNENVAESFKAALDEQEYDTDTDIIEDIDIEDIENVADSLIIEYMIDNNDDLTEHDRKRVQDALKEGIKKSRKGGRNKDALKEGINQDDIKEEQQ